MKNVYLYQHPRRLVFAAICLFSLFAPMYAFSEEYKPCGISLDSLSVTSGAPGDVFEMRGRWGENQGAKIPAINKGGLGRLEVVFWTDKVLTVRIPVSLAPGTYRVGVYCNDLSQGGSYSSGWTNFELRATARPVVDALVQPVIASPATTFPSAHAPPSVEKQPENRQSRSADAVATVRSANQWLKDRLHLPDAVSRLGFSVFHIIIGAVVIVIAAILIGLLLKRRARPIDPMAEYLASNQALPPAASQSKKTASGAGSTDEKSYTRDVGRGRLKDARREPPAPIQGSFEGVRYQAECLGHTMPDYIPQITVWIHLDASAKRPFTVRHSDKAIDVVSDNPQAIGVITTIFMLGAEDIDFGYSTNWAAALMTPGLDVNESLAGQVAAKLVQLKRLCW